MINCCHHDQSTCATILDQDVIYKGDKLTIYNTKHDQLIETLSPSYEMINCCHHDQS
jgi:hypothetical protein